MRIYVGGRELSGIESTILRVGLMLSAMPEDEEERGLDVESFFLESLTPRDGDDVV